MKKERMASSSSDENSIFPKNQRFLVVLLFLILLITFVLCISFISASDYQVKVTEEHPFYVIDNGLDIINDNNRTGGWREAEVRETGINKINGEWKTASELKVGDKLKTIDGKTATITKLIQVHSDEPISVYNLEASPFNDFVVEGGVVVHNSEVYRRPTGLFEKFYQLFYKKNPLEFPSKFFSENSEFLSKIENLKTGEHLGFDDSQLSDKELLYLKSYLAYLSKNNNFEYGLGRGIDLSSLEPKKIYYVLVGDEGFIKPIASIKKSHILDISFFYHTHTDFIGLGAFPFPSGTSATCYLRSKCYQIKDCVSNLIRLDFKSAIQVLRPQSFGDISCYDNGGCLSYFEIGVMTNDGKFRLLRFKIPENLDKISGLQLGEDSSRCQGLWVTIPGKGKFYQPIMKELLGDDWRNIISNWDTMSIRQLRLLGVGDGIDFPIKTNP